MFYPNYFIFILNSWHFSGRTAFTKNRTTKKIKKFFKVSNFFPVQVFCFSYKGKQEEILNFFSKARCSVFKLKTLIFHNVFQNSSSTYWDTTGKILQIR